MAKSRDKVPQLGFWDTEVSSPDHDAVCMWAYENAETILRYVHPEAYDREWSSAEIKIERPDINKEWVKTAKAFAASNSRPNPRIVRKELEYVLTSYTGYNNKIERIVGYADLLVAASVPKIIGDYIDNPHSGYAEELKGLEITWCIDARDSLRVLVEAKSKLPSIGELMRQLQLYRTVFRGRMVVVSPDDSYENILKEQGISFVRSEV